MAHQNWMACGVRSVAPLVLAAWLAHSPANAQWTSNGVAIVQGPLTEDLPRLTTDADGGAIVVYRVFGGTSDVYAQRITRDGVIPPGWPAAGVPICTDPANQFEREIASDGFGGAYIVWADRRHQSPETVDQIYLQRVLADGTIAPGWTPNGIRVCEAPVSQNLPRVAADGAGGVYVVWDDRRRGIAFRDVQVDVYAQRILPDGAIAPGWPLDGLPVCTAPGSRGRTKVVPDAGGGAFLVWDDGRLPESWDVYASRVTPEGAIVAGWPADGLPVCTAPGNQDATRVIADGAGGFIVAWLDDRATPHGADPFPLHIDVYAQRVTPDGALAPGWPVDGAPVCTAYHLQQDVALVSDGGGGAILAWSDYRNYDESAADLYAQRIGPDGQPALGWPVNGVALSRAPYWQVVPTMAPDGVGGALVAFGTTDGGSDDLYAQHVLSTGVIGNGWGPNGVGLCLLPGIQSRPAAVSDGAMGMIVVWEDTRNVEATGTDLYAQQVTAQFPTATLPTARIDAEPGLVRVSWTFVTDAPRSASVQRRTEASDWAALAVVLDTGTGRFEYEDRTVGPGRYAYRLAYRIDGGEAFTSETWVTVPSGHVLALAGFTPNPVFGRAIVLFVLASAERATLALFDAAGRAVLAREVGALGPGRHTFDLGRAVALPPGVYWLKLTQGVRALTAKGLVLR